MFAVIYIPHFPLQAVLRHSPELHTRPVAVVEQRTATKAVILHMTEAARAHGVHEGMSSTQAMARCAQIVIKLQSAVQETATQEVLLQFAYGFSPFIEATAPGLCTIDLRGKADRCTEALVTQIRTLNLHAQIGVGETPDLALIAARHARPFLWVENSRAFLDSLPVASLDPSPEISGILESWGIRSAGAFRALGKRDLVERLGEEAMTMFDRMAAKKRRPLKLVAPPERYEESIEFEQEIELLEPLLFMLRRFLEQIAQRLQLIWLVVEELRLRLAFSSGGDYERSFRIPSPTCDVDVLFRMLHTHLENFRAEDPIVALSLEAIPARPENRQFGLFETALRDPNQFYETLARLTALLGNDRVGRPVVEETHRPDAFRLEPLALQFKAFHSKFETPPLLPLRRFRPPCPVRVRLQNGTPVLTSGGEITGPLRTAQGPWRISGDWWDRKNWSHQEWDVELADGSLCRLYEDGESWFADGIYD